MKKKMRKITGSIAELERRVKTMYENKYYNLFMTSMEWGGLEPEQEDYLMKKFWSMGTIAAFNIKGTGEIAFADYATAGYNIYDFPADVNLINKLGVPFIPTTNQVVNEDVVIGWAQSNHKPIREIVSYYIDRIVSVELTLNNNLQIQKMPFMVGVSEADIDKAQDIVDRILNNEVAVFADMEDLNNVKSFVFNSPYIIDKLYSYKTSLENELLTFLGLDNALQDDTKDRLVLDQVNANNALINANLDGMLYHFKNFCKQVKEVLNQTITVKTAHELSVSVHEEVNGKDGGDKDDE